ncbi:hypothetical protein [Dysgonomonas sp. 25]|uniref:hypothetical protein n=1 Tax=Dysgonomonas sp. 25 TaxID=2302933 RepID=UPI0013D7FA62|nr:hypothetical protein [Dysgonomonas sp. 25]NDV68638.1 hypothetical protein [Dysgonomonas sp. 25]
MRKIELNFDEAWQYLKFLCDMGLQKSQIAEFVGCSRRDISAAMNGIIEAKTNKPIKLPEKYHPKIIELVQVLQLETWRKQMKTNENKNIIQRRI